MLVAVSVIGCAEANFGSKTGKQTNGSDAINAGDTKPVNVSDGHVEGNGNGDGPTSGTGQRIGKTIEVGCENSGGIIVDIGDVDLNNPEVGEPTDEDIIGNEDFYLTTLGQEKILDKNGKNTADKEGPYKKGGKNPEIDPVITPTESNVTARVKGKFCPQSSKKLTVMFVVDMSGSMGRHVPNSGPYRGTEHPGYDPQINGTCGRLQAAQAIMGRIASQTTQGDDVRVGLVAFAGGVISNRFIDLKQFERFAPHMNKDTFCQYVTQGSAYGYDPVNPGGIDGKSGLFGLGSVDSSTNYNAAFRGARSALQGEYGRKVVYFISDGEPTSGGSDPVAAGIEAGRQFRQSVDNLSMNALLLGNPGPHARDVLEQVAGSPARVRSAENADELASQILNFPVASIDPATARALLTISPYGTTDIGFTYFRESAPNSNIWEYETTPFTLLGIPGTATVNLLEILAEGTDGSTHSGVFRIKFHR